MKMLMDNQADLATVTAFSNGWDAEFPASNVQAVRLSQKAKTDASTYQPTIHFDFGSAYEPAFLVLAEHDLATAPAATSLLLAGGTSDGGDEVVILVLTPEISAGTMVVDLSTITPFSGALGPARYWTLKFDKDTATDVKNLGRVYLGPIIETGDLGSPDYDGVTETTTDRTEVDQSIGGQEYIEEKSQTRSWALDFSLIPESEMSDIVDRYLVVGKHTPFFIQIATVSPLDEFLYCRFTNNLGRKIGAFDSQFHWDTAMALKEFI